MRLWRRWPAPTIAKATPNRKPTSRRAGAGWLPATSSPCKTQRRNGRTVTHAPLSRLTSTVCCAWRVRCPGDAICCSRRSSCAQDGLILSLSPLPLLLLPAAFSPCSLFASETPRQLRALGYFSTIPRLGLTS